MIKYQIFISSTFEDLKAERDQVIKAVLEMGHIPVGMEMFSAADEEQWKIIQSHIAASDYYVVLVAHRYGSMVSGVSFTEKEYDYAISCKIPTLGFILHDSAPWAETKRDAGPDVTERASKLVEFKRKIKGKPVGFWQNTDDLYAKVVVALMKTFSSQPRTGWIPGNLARTLEEVTRLGALQEKITALTEENQSLTQQKVDLLKNQSIPARKQLAIQTDLPAFFREVSLEWEMEEAATVKDPRIVSDTLNRMRQKLMSYLKELDENSHFQLIRSLKDLIRQIDEAIRRDPFKSMAVGNIDSWYSQMKQIMQDFENLKDLCPLYLPKDECSTV